VLVVDRDNCRVWETFATYPNGDGTWRAGSGATWDLRSNALKGSAFEFVDESSLMVNPDSGQVR